MLCEYLIDIGTPDDDKLKEGFRQMDANRILDALLKLRNPKAVEAIRTYLQKNSDPTSRPNIERVLVHLETTNPVPELIRMFDAAGVGAVQKPESTSRIGPLSHFVQHGGDEHFQSRLIEDMSSYQDTQVPRKLGEIVLESESAFLRREAIFGLGRSKVPGSLEKLVSLLNITFPENLRVTWGWRERPESIDAELKRAVVHTLKYHTGQDFGTSHAEWEAWLKTRQKG